MEFLMEHWLSLGVGVFLLSMILYGHYRGFLRMAVSMLALVVSMVVVPVAMPHVTRFLNDNTTIHQAIGRGLLDMAGVDERGGFWENAAESPTDPSAVDTPDGSQEEMLDGTTGAQPPSKQREIIERLKLPEQMKESLLEHNNSEIYSLLGVDAFLDYLGSYLAHMVINLIGAVVLFLVVYIGIRILIKWLDLIAKLPILHGMNQIAGAVLGGIQGLLFIWLLCLIVRVCSGTQWAQAVLAQIENSIWLRFLYEENLFNWLFVTVLNSLAP